MKPLNLVLAAALAVSTGGLAIAQSTNQSADPFAVQQKQTLADFGFASTAPVISFTVAAGIITLVFLDGDGNESTTTTPATP